MQDYQTDHSSGARLIGGEMLEWSDRESTADLGVIPVCLDELLTRGRGRILLVGSRAAQLLDVVPSDVDVDIIVRALPDARELSATASLRPNTTVWCGGVERLDRTGQYDTIVVLGGPERVLTPDSPGMDTAGLLQLLAERLADNGEVVAVVANGMSVADWLELPLEARSVVNRPIRSMALTLEAREPVRGPERERFVGDNANDRWWQGTSGFADRSPYLSELADELSTADLTLGRAWASYPHPDHPRMLVDTAALDDDRWNTAARSRAVAAQTELFATVPALADPAQTVDRVFAAGLGAAMAPAWLVVAQRGEVELPPGPTMAWSDGYRPQFWGAAWTAAEHAPAGDGEDARVGFVPVEPRVAMEGPLERAVEPQTWPYGPSLESHFRTALESGNHQRIRALVRKYSDWVRAEWGNLGDAAMAATMDNLTVTNDGYELTDRTWRWHARSEPEVVIARGVRRAAMRLLRAGLGHPWRTDISPDELAVTMMIMEGTEEPDEVVELAATVDAEWEALLAQVSAGERQAFIQTQLDAGRSQFTAMPAPAPGYRETVVRSSRMATELEVRQGQVEWLEAALRMRESRMASVERNIDDIRGSMSYKFGRVVTAPGRRIAQSARRGVLRMVPRDLMDKAERAARRLLK